MKKAQQLLKQLLATEKATDNPQIKQGLWLAIEKLKLTFNIK